MSVPIRLVSTLLNSTPKLPIHNFGIKQQLHTARSFSSLSADLIETAAKIVGADNLSVSEAVRLQHGRDESYHAPLPPDLVLHPSNTQQVSDIAKLCTLHRVPLIPFGTGTGLEGGVGATRGGISLNLTRMDQISEVSTEDLLATVRPGVTRNALNNYLRDTGMWFPIDPGADASLCGMAATSASGTNAVRYGTMKDNVINLEVVLACGDVIHTSGAGFRAKKSSAGYNLTGLFIGSEGTLGVITAATLRLYGIPESVASAVCSFPSIADAVSTATLLIQTGVPVARLEFLDDVMMDACNKYSGLTYDVTSTLFLEFHGCAGSVSEQAETAKQIAEDNSCKSFQWATDPEEIRRLWRARHRALYAAKALLTDVCVPISSLAEVLLQTKQRISCSGCVAPIVGHVGDGNFHCCFLVKPGDTRELERVKEIATWLGRLAIRVGGTCAGEHGVGRGKVLLVEEQHGAARNVMNPGKVIRI